MALIDLSLAAKEADAAFTTELWRVYGHDACEARYRRSHEDAACEAAGRRKVAADKSYLDALESV